MSAATGSALVLVRSLSLYHMVALPLFGSKARGCPLCVYAFAFGSKARGCPLCVHAIVVGFDSICSLAGVGSSNKLLLIRH